MNKELFRQLKKFDPVLCEVLSFSLERQISTLSLIPTDNAASPLSKYLKGSELGDDFIGHNALEHYSRIEQLAVQRVCEVFKSEHAILRTGNPVAASRVVLMAFAKNGDNILSFNLRKSEHCTGEQMKFNFIKFAVEPNNFKINFDKLRYVAIKNKPKMIIYSPVNYPKNIEYKNLRKIADESGALLWIDLGQNAGLVAAEKISSPVPFADVLTFAGSDGLHGPQSGIILTKKKFADVLEKTVIETGHASLKKNVMASLAITFKEIVCNEYKEFAQSVLDNARALENGLKKSGAEILCSPTENHLVLVHVKNCEEVTKKLEQANLLVKAENLQTADSKISYPILRLSSLNPTTRALPEDDMFEVGIKLGEFLKSPQDEQAIKSVQKFVKNVVEDLPLFSHDWLPDDEIFNEHDADLMMKTMIYGF